MVRMRPFIALSALYTLSLAADAQAASLYDTKCHSLTGTNVSAPATSVGSVTIVQRPGTLPTHDGRRREHVRISAGLATDLGISATDLSLSNESPQIRVSLGTNLPTANFTVDAIDATDTGDTVAIWLPNNVSGGTFTDKDNGFFKLYGFQDPAVVFAAAQSGTVHDTAPGTTVVVSSGVVTRNVHFTEPNSSTGKQFRECVEVRGDDTVALLVPHGGGIETGISDQVAGFLTDLDGYGYEASAWEGSGQWGSGSTFQRWHITSPQISEASFPGYAALAASGPYDYAVALHGFTRSERAVVLGGSSSRQAKCRLIDEIEGYLAATGDDRRITYKVYAPDGDEVDVIRDSTGPNDTPAALTGVDELAGTDADNIVNRIAPNPTGARGSGGIQLEMSGGLRDDTALFALFIEALALGVAEEIDDPTGDYCAQYE